MRKTQEHKLVEFLTKLPKESIDGLIDILTDFGNGRVALNSNVKEILLHESKLSTSHCYSKEFIELLITEYQLFAGNSIVNQIRENLVTYEEIVQNVHSYLIDDSKKASTDIIKMERDILHKLLGHSWIETNYNQRYGKSTSKSLFIKKLTNKKVKVSTVGLVAIGANLVSRINIPVAIGTTIFSLSAEAYRVMIPFVLEISWLKATCGFYSKNMLLSRKEKNFDTRIRKIEQDNISTLNQLLILIPDLLIKKEMSDNNIAVINIPLEKLTKAKDLDGLRGMVHGEKGIVENVRIYEPEKLTNLVNSGLLMNLVSTLVAQKHLADINDKLNDIKENISDIKDFLLNERKSRLSAAYQASSKLYNMLAKGKDIPETEVTMLSLHLTHIREVYEHIKIDMQELLLKMANIKSMQSKNSYTIFYELNMLYSDIKLCCNSMLSIYAILFLIKKDEYYIEQMNEIGKEMSNYLNSILERVKSKIDHIALKSKSNFNFNSTELANIAFQNNRKLDLEINFSLSREEISKFSSSFFRLNNQNKSLEIKAVLEDGLIKEAVLV